MASEPPTPDEIATRLKDLNALLARSTANKDRIKDLKLKQIRNVQSHMTIMVRGKLDHDAPITETAAPKLTVDGERDVRLEQLRDLQQERNDTERELKDLGTEEDELEGRIEEIRDWFTTRGRYWRTGEVLKGGKKRI